MNSETPREKLGPEIYDMKHALITYLNALWQTVDVLHALRYGDAELITDDQKILYRLSLLADDVNRQIGLAEHLSEVLASGLEVLQSIYNNQLQALNNRMAMVMTYLTIIGTAVLVPNTLATILGNSAFAMEPNDVGWYWALLVGSTVVATALAYWWVKRRGWLPKKAV
jgi:magnesium transporter